MKAERATAQKRNAYKIRTVVSQSIFKQLIVAQCGEELKNTQVGRFDKPMLSCLAGIATKGVMESLGIDVVLKKQS